MHVPGWFQRRQISRIFVGCFASIIIYFSTDEYPLVRLIYPTIFVAVAASQFAMSLVGVFAKWTQNIRDKEFLVEMRLRNLEHSRKLEKVEQSSTVASVGDQEEGEIGMEDDD